MVHEMQQKIYLPDSDTEEDKDGNDNSLESSYSSASGVDDLVSIAELKKIVSSSSLLSQSLKQDKDVSWNRLKRSK